MRRNSRHTLANEYVIEMERPRWSQLLRWPSRRSIYTSNRTTRNITLPTSTAQRAPTVSGSPDLPTEGTRNAKVSTDSEPEIVIIGGGGAFEGSWAFE